ncbi:hypothetical protein EJ08DRAFT_62376 [Tothia fuscella]|uniref:Uncharacterized protein n=1 Tax=Tothia fuscella TaxID=1048955 RepID=A0A9P4NEY1_9PEZI|nr:hypothetical protein EJ08DRAFT_62376 [Tothia fuscella]
MNDIFRWLMSRMLWLGVMYIGKPGLAAHGSCVALLVEGGKDARWVGFEYKQLRRTHIFVGSIQLCTIAIVSYLLVVLFLDIVILDFLLFDSSFRFAQNSTTTYPKMSPQLSLLTSILLASSTTSSGAAQSSSTAIHSITASGTQAQITGSVGTISVASLQNRTSSSLPVIKAQTTVSLFNACSGSSSLCADIDALTYYGEVVTADKSSTIYALDCASGNHGRKNQTQCWSAPMTVTAGPSLFQRVNQVDDQAPVTVSCKIGDDSKSAVCEQKATRGPGSPFATGAVSAQGSLPTGSAGGYGDKTVEVTTLKFNEDDIHYNALVITKGADKLSATDSIATRTPLPPTGKCTASLSVATEANNSIATNNPATSPTKTGAAISKNVPVSASLAGVVAVVFAVFSI